MLKIKNSVFESEKLAIGFFLLFLLLIGMFSVVSALAFPKDNAKPETIEATARGTEAQMGKEFPITLTIEGYSSKEDNQIMADAFRNGGNQGLFNALSKMKPVGHIAVTGSLGYDVSYIQASRTENGRKIRFVTNRLLRLGEVYHDTRSSSYNLTVGEFDINDEDKSKSTGVFYPEAALTINKQGELQYDLIGFPWQFVDVIDWKGTPGVN
jgi:hypothetical protein